MDSKDSNQKHEHHHHILSTKTILTIGGALLFLTWFTVFIAGVDLGRFNFVIAMFVATVKGSLVALIFMNLKYDRKENAVIFVASFLFLAIFGTLSATDLFFRGDVYLKGAIASANAAPSKLKKPWVSTPELVAHGKELFAVQCTSCHGAEGQGNGPAAAALVPHPRNFTQNEGWKNGRRVAMIFKTLKEGIPGSAMASFSTLPADDRWALAQYVLTLNPTPPAPSSAADFAAIGVDPTKENGGGAAEEKFIPVELAMQRMAEPDLKVVAVHEGSVESTAPGAVLYQNRCASCHGASGEGNIKVKAMGVNPQGFVTAPPFTSRMESLGSAERFNHVVIQGIQGDLMPSNGDLSGGQLKDLYQYTKSLSNH